MVPGPRGCTDIGKHLVAVTAKPALATELGIHQVLPMTDGMGGRFSVWSAVGLPLAIALGSEHFLDFIRGGAAMDQHFAQAPWESNLPVWLGLLNVWNRAFLRQTGRCVASYHHGLRRLPAYLQQLEWNGKQRQARRHAWPAPVLPYRRPHLG